MRNIASNCSVSYLKRSIPHHQPTTFALAFDNRKTRSKERKKSETNKYNIMYLRYVRQDWHNGFLRRGTLFYVHFHPNEKGGYNEFLTPYALHPRSGHSRRSHPYNKEKHPHGCLFCRGEATRTPDPHVPNVVRYQLRYSSKASAKVLLFSHLSKQSKKKHIIFSENCVSISFLWALVSSMHEHLLRSKAIHLPS